MFDLHGRVAVVTGASAGLGRQFALALARQGADLAIMARREWKLNEVAEEIRALGVKCLVAPCDVTKLDQILAAKEKIMAEYGKVDILVNDAGGGSPAPLVDHTDDSWIATVDLDVFGTMRCTREFGKDYLDKRYCKPEEVADLAVFLASPVSSHMMGSGLRLDAGMDALC